MTRADLHSHTTASDGLDSPAELVRRASNRGITVLAVTDHDTTSGVAAAVEEAARLRIDLIPGVEFSIRARYGQTHMLGYGIDLENPALQRELGRLRRGRHERGHRIVERLAQLGVPIEIPDANGQDSPGRPHIARALIEAGAATSIEDAFDRFLAFGRPAFVPRPILTAREAVDLIRGSGGVAVVAHPLSVHDLESKLPEFVELGVAGLEAHYGAYDRCQRRRLVDLAMSYGLLVTGGSDYHGVPEASGRELGVVDWPEADLKALLEWLG